MKKEVVVVEEGSKTSPAELYTVLRREKERKRQLFILSTTKSCLPHIKSLSS